MGVKLKISSGYALLFLLSAVVICLFRGEKARRDTLKEKVSELADIRKLTTKAYISLLDLSSRAEVASVWTENDFNGYCTRQETLHETLKLLRQYIHTPEQQVRIDSFNLLLYEKQQLLATIMNTFVEATEVSEIVSKKIPVIVSQIPKDPQRTNREIPPPQRKKSIWNFFRKKETKSAYLQQRERQPPNQMLL